MPGVTILPGPTILKRNRRARSGHFPRLRQPGRAGLSVRFLQTPHRDSGRWMSHARKYEKKREKKRKKEGPGARGFQWVLRSRALCRVDAGVLTLIAFVCWTNFAYMKTRKDALPTEQVYSRHQMCGQRRGIGNDRRPPRPVSMMMMPCQVKSSDDESEGEENPGRT